MNERTPETGFARRCPFPVGSWGLQNRPSPPPPLASWEGNRQPNALPAPNAPGSLGALLAEEQRASRAGGNSSRHELVAAGDRSWGDAQIDRQIAFPSPAPAPTFPTRQPPGAAQARRSPTPVPAPLPRASAPPSSSFSRLGILCLGLTLKRLTAPPEHSKQNETPFLSACKLLKAALRPVAEPRSNHEVAR